MVKLIGQAPAKVFVTGGAGFIGSHLVDRLLGAGHRVAVVDNFATGRESNLAHAAGHVTLHRADIAADDLVPLFAGATTVFHLAGLADIVPSIERPVEYFRTNVDGTMRVMEAARAAGVAKVVYAASSSCYGIPDVFPTDEQAAVRPQYPYALTKYLGELTALHWGQVYGIPVVSLRLFNVYGPRSRTTGAYGAVFGVFLAQKLAGKPYTVVGDGKQTRDFTYVTDVAEAFLAAATSPAAGEIFNVGSGGTYAINELVALLGGDVTYVAKRPGEPDCTFADVRKIERVLGWRACVSFRTGVGLMLDNVELWRDAPVWDREGIERATAAWFTHLGKERAVS
ncbi:MAG: SDR family oxidoreductase [Actinobacteria bacterium]|nr:SDR family oxidoreductase [Actinomycetota bacterium]